MKIKLKIENNKKLKELKVHMPFDIDDSKTEDNKHLKTLVQDEFTTRYSGKRRTPLYTLEKLDGAIIKFQRENKVIL